MDAKDFLLKKGYQLVKKIGQGSYAIVYKATRVSDRKVMAVKIISVSKLDPKQLENALTEVRIICAIKHPNIVEYHDAFVDQKNRDLYLIMEYLGGGDLSGRIGFLQRAKSRLSEAQVWRYSLQILQGLRTLHQAKIIHRDIKPGNLFLSDDFQTLKVGDLNTSKIMGDKKLTNTVIGTPFYLAPEIWRNSQYDYRCDVFSMGCVVYEMAMLQPPFKASSVEELYRLVKRGQYPPVSSKFSGGLKTFVAKCLVTNFKMRPSIRKLMDEESVRKQLKEHSDLDCRREAPRRGNMNWSHLKTPRNMQDVKDALDSFRNMSRGVSQRNKAKGKNYAEVQSKVGSSYKTNPHVKKSWTGKISGKPQRQSGKSSNRGRVKIYGHEKRPNRSKVGRKSGVSQKKQNSSFHKKPRTQDKRALSRRSLVKRTTSQMKKSQSEALKNGYKFIYKKKVKSGIKDKMNKSKGTSVSLTKTKKKDEMVGVRAKQPKKSFTKSPMRKRKTSSNKGVNIRFIKHRRRESNISKEVPGGQMVQSELLGQPEFNSRLSSKLFKFDTESGNPVEMDPKLRKKSLIPLSKLSQKGEELNAESVGNGSRKKGSERGGEGLSGSISRQSQPSKFQTNVMNDNPNRKEWTRGIKSKHSFSEANLNGRFAGPPKNLKEGELEKEVKSRPSAHEKGFVGFGNFRTKKVSRSPNYNKYKQMSKHHSFHIFKTQSKVKPGMSKMSSKQESPSPPDASKVLVKEGKPFINKLENDTGYLNNYLNKNLQK
jgi:NIMA (never in mitosis gene a)-related kinase